MAGSDNETTTRFNVDISNLRAGIQEANRQIRLANAEFNAAASGMDDWANSAEGVEAKISQLESVLENENRKLEVLNRQLELTEQEYGSNSRAAEELRIAIANQQATINRTQRELGDYRNRLDDIEDGSDDVEDATKEMGDGFTVLKGAMASLVADGIKNVLSSFASLADETREYRNEMAKLETAFESASLSSEAAKDTYEELYSIMADEGAATEAAQQLAKISKNQKDLETNTKILTGVMGEYGGSIPLEGLAEGMAATAAMGSVQGSLADALEWQGVNLDDFNEKLGAMSSEEERSAYVQKTLIDMYGDTADAYRENNKTVIEANKAQGKLTDTYAKLGEKAEPIVTTLKQGFADLLAKVLEFIDGADISEITSKIEEGFKKINEDVLPPIKSAIQWIIDNKDGVIAGIAGIGAAMLTMNVANMIMGVVKSFKAFKAAQEGATVAQWLLNAAMNANPIGLVVAAIVGLVTAFVVLWNKSDAFREFWINLWEKIKEVGSVAWEKIKGFFTAAWEKIQEVWDFVQPYFLAVWEAIKAIFSKVVSVLGAYFDAAWAAIKTVWDAVSGYFEQVWETIKGIFAVVKDVLSGNFDDAWEKIKDIVKGWAEHFSGIWDDIKGVFAKVDDYFSEMFGDAWDKVKEAFSGVGKFFGDMWDTIKEKFVDIGNNVGEAVSGAFKNAVNWVLEKAIGLINGFIGNLNGAIGLINEIPGVDISKIKKLPVPELWQGGIAKKGRAYLLEGRGDEAVVPLHNNKKWIRKTAQDLKAQLQSEGAISGGNGGSVTNNYNFTQNNTSPKALSRLEIYRQTKNQIAFMKGV